VTTDHREIAQSRVEALITQLRTRPEPGAARLVEECEALSRAIKAFHMEGIRFRMYNVDRLMHGADFSLPPEATALFTDARRELEAAGFHTRSH
jgi:hypothetical protein